EFGHTDGVEIKSLSQQVNIYAIFYGAADDAKKERIARRLFDDTRLRDTTFYFAHYLHQAARQLHQPERVIKDLARWKSMLDMGTSTWWEQPGQTRSDCHAWSATPTFTLMQMVLGVQPAAPGYQKVRIQPCPGELQWAQGIVPTPHGNIRIKWNAQPRFTLEVTIPEGIEAEVVLPSGAKSTLPPGEHTVTEQG
ncbi:MAG TPA: alpha-L-rhamnosidase C-terminal domain-containing protein, partial [bacterium]|nr:alpha-L-rhamnosidase C-terminal domain-containing protein [bacterium]